MNIPIKKIKVDLTSLCNLSCNFCPYHGIDGEIISGKSLDKKIIFNLLNDLNELDSKPTIRFAGTGESLCHPDFEEISEYLISKNMKFRLITNGTRINKYLSLLSSSLDRLVVSVHGDENIHDSLTGVKGSFNKAISGIKNLKKLNSDLDIVLHMAITPKNYHQIISHANLAIQLGVMPRYQHFRMTVSNLEMGSVDSKEVSTYFIRLIEKGIDFSTIPKLSFDRLSDYYDSSKVFIKDAKYCSPLIDDIHVRYDGNVFICDSIYVGSLNEKSILDIINSPKRKDHINYMNYCIDKSGSLPSELCTRCRFH